MLQDQHAILNKSNTTNANRSTHIFMTFAWNSKSNIYQQYIMLNNGPTRCSSVTEVISQESEMHTKLIFNKFIFTKLHAIIIS